MLSRSSASTSRNLVRALTVLIFLLVLYNVWTASFSPFDTTSSLQPAAAAAATTPTPSAGLPPPLANVPCPTSLPGAEDTLVILKTGATEAEEKVPIHLSTTIRCLPHTVIYSDYAETLGGQQIHDALDGAVSERARAANEEFRFYDRLRAGGGRAGFGAAELARWAAVANGQEGMQGNPAWRLDKWKFLPLVDAALRHRPTARWFIFIEADTYVLWPNLLTWLARLDADAPLYLGSEMQILDDVFAYGGAGFVLSNPAARMVAEQRAQQAEAYENLTAEYWAGDCVLGKTLKDVGVRLTYSWPGLQTGRMSDMDWTEERGPANDGSGTASSGRRLWCHRALSYHHVSPEEIDLLWRVEHDAAARNASLQRHADVFTSFILPQLSSPKPDWDNLSDESVFVNGTVDTPIGSFADCRRACEDVPGCVQFSYRPNNCRVSLDVKLGQAVEAGDPTTEVRSGWLVDRVERFVEGMGTCEGEKEWVLQ